MRPSRYLSAGFATVLAWALSSQPVLARDDAGFDDWLAGLRAEALSAGISQATIDAATAGLEPDPEVVALDRNQPSGRMSFAEYRARRLTPSIIAHGRRMMVEHESLLNDVARRYRVQPRFIAAIWGMETSYGRITGGRGVVRSLATLAWDDRRPAFFRKELLTALRILDDGHVTLDRMQGSWAGAMGQSQFMPTSWVAYSADFDGDGRRDIWDNQGDVFASIANYLARHGWRDDQTWGRPVTVPHDFAERAADTAADSPPPGCKRAMKDHSRVLGLAQWQAMGVRRLNGADLPAVEIDATLVQPDGPGGQAYLTYPNYRSILTYNCSNYYALSVGLLASALAAAP